MRKILTKFFLLFILPISVFSQENDFQTWTSVSASKKIIKRTNLIVKQGARFRENSSIYSKLFTDLKIKRKYNKYFSYALGYHHSSDWDKHFDVEKKNRFYADVYYKDKYYKRYLLGVRTRWQTQGNMFGYNMALRQKMAFAYNIKKTKLEPSVGLEYFLYFDRMLIEKLRYTFGFSHPITKDLDMQINYRIQQEFYTNNPETLYIFEGKLSYDF
ncbi:MAG: DUF2490 domain-containing protein [Flavobacteriales bacterium]|nr:DUF2490 domain-containing protein [Flavobacteriales bacterium]